jgi:hypothetical protein
MPIVMVLLINWFACERRVDLVAQLPRGRVSGKYAELVIQLTEKRKL